ncbi:MAG: hypothetical protein RMJ17_03100 [Candidatus Aenigmarchaeota archaeon]|nr:hypothetical protein [Candidatus Aenigmarchaeota archaeon]MDW8149554.1 hypothetical protein [Candidatus Aenigmarchaeota archaeon]
MIEPLWYEKNQVGLTRKEILAKHYQVYGRIIPEWFLKQEILPPLENSGLIYQEQDPQDKRRVLVFVPTPPLNSTYEEVGNGKKYVEYKGGVGKYVEYKGGVFLRLPE